ncbi:MAG TPA: PAS domain S-box protein, partial [Pirellulaceae bacterium]
MRTEEGLLLLSADGTILWANSAAASLLGYSRVELCCMALPLIGGGTIPGSLGPVGEAFRAIRDEELEETEGDARFPDRDGKRVALHWKMWRTPAGRAEKQVLLALSATALATPESVITSGYRDVFEFAVEGIFRSTIEGRYLEVNPALARMFGYSSPAELIHRIPDISTHLYVRPNQRAEFVRQMEQAGFVSGFEIDVWKSDRSIISIAVFARTVRDPSGLPLYFEGSVIDITERKRAEAALKRSEERFRRLAETTRVVPFEFDLASQRFSYVGPQAEALLGHPIRQGARFESWMEILHPDDREIGTRFAREGARGSTSEFQTEF